MASRSILALAGAIVAVQAASDLPTVAIPLMLRDGQSRRVATSVVLPNTVIEIVYDQGSSDFFMFETGSTMNWGCRRLLCQGACNVTVSDVFSYNPALSDTKSGEQPWDGMYNYGGGLFKSFRSNKVLNDTFVFSNNKVTPVAVPNVQVALAQYLQQRVYDPNGTCDPVPNDYSKSILGIAPFVDSPDDTVIKTQGPSFRENLLNSGAISNKVQSLWFDKPPSGAVTSGEPYIGTGLLGGIDTSKYTGPLVRIPRTHDTRDQGYYYTRAANMTFFAGGAAPGVAIENDFSPNSGTNMLQCLIDSGAGSESFNPADKAAWYNTTGLRVSPDRTAPGDDIAWPGPCDTIPADSYFEYSFVAGVRESDPKEATVRIPLRNYHRYQDPLDEARGWCTVAIYLNGCALSRTFNTAVFWAADDATGEMAIAQGGVSEIGSGVDYASVVGAIP
ncbi:pepsin-like aspartyl protease [Microdochium nivale]|nr:pepsin-like aspartyl protease [Microdochium nivale]